MGTIFCFVSCTNKDQVPRVDFYLDLSQAQYSQLLNIGGCVIVSNVIVANKDGANYLAMNGLCPMHGCNLAYAVSQHVFTCSCNLCQFSETGAVTMGPNTTALKTYLTLKTGNMLHVYEQQ